MTEDEWLQKGRAFWRFAMGDSVAHMSDAELDEWAAPFLKAVDIPEGWPLPEWALADAEDEQG